MGHLRLVSLARLHYKMLNTREIITKHLTKSRIFKYERHLRFGIREHGGRNNYGVQFLDAPQ